MDARGGACHGDGGDGGVAVRQRPRGTSCCRRSHHHAHAMGGEAGRCARPDRWRRNSRKFLGSSSCGCCWYPEITSLEYQLQRLKKMHMAATGSENWLKIYTHLGA